MTRKLPYAGYEDRRVKNGGQALKARGIRFSDEAWENLTKEADKLSSTPSDIIRGLVDEYYSKKKNSS